MTAIVPTQSDRLPHSPEFRDTTSVLMLNTPFFATLFMRYKHVATSKVSTLAVGVKTFLYNPDFLRSLSDGGRLAAFAHEVMHGVLQHVQMQAEYYQSNIGPDGKAFDRDRWAKAIDYCVNGQIKEAGIGQVQPSWFCDTARFPTTMTPMEIYVALEDDQQGGGGAGGGGNTPGPLDEHGLDEDADFIEGDVEPAITESAVINAARVAKTMGGKVPAVVERMIGELTRPKSDPWKVLRKFISDVASGRDNTSMRRLQRKLVVRGLGAPGRDGFRLGRVGIVIDLSGSIGQSELDLFGAHIALILQEYKPKEVRIAWTDTEVHRLDVVKDMSSLKSAFSKPVNAGGGTDLEVAYEDLGRCDVVAVLTDGYTPFRQRPKFPVVWAMTTNVVAPYGKTVAI